MLDYSLVGVSRSLAAASSLWLTFYLLEEEFDEDIEWTASLQYYTGYKLQDVVDMVNHSSLINCIYLRISYLILHPLTVIVTLH